MELSGIVRRIDDLGRIVIPKEMRKKVKIDEGDQVEIVLKTDGKIEIKKYLPLGDKYDVMQKLIDSLSKNIGYKVVMTDKEKVIVDTSKSKEFIDENITPEVIDYIRNRENFLLKSGRGKRLLIERADIETIAVFPIIVDNDSIGSICILQSISRNKLELNDMNIIKYVLEFLQTYV
ncbi:MAG: AbrB/MazE/SpoVT family DNA-binding domain-containing protein [Clostridia bacterium]|nr:AbrB/MazE/SpoVT family DNA-binding domain-containing protein [Clostridia bacterium]